MKDKSFSDIFKIKSIKGNIILSFICVFIFIIGALAISLSYYVREAYYTTIYDNLKKQIVTAVENYEKNNFNLSLETSIILDLDNFSNMTNAQVQVIDLEGKVIMDTIGVSHNSIIDTNDFKMAKNGEIGKWIGKVSYNKSNVISMAHPIRNYSQVVGVVRFIVSLDSANQNINSILITFILGAFIALIFYIIISGFVANKIIDPIKSLTDVANNMAEGKMDIRCDNLPENEVGTLGRTLNYMADELVKKDELKNDFISTVSHELRTPLTSIKGWAITMEYDNTDKELISQGLNIIKDEAERLSEMVEELLDFSKFISQKVSLKFSSIKVDEIREYMFNYIKPRSEREGFVFEIEVLSHNLKNLNLTIDFNRIKQVIINILDNSIKFLKQNGRISVNFIYTDEKFILIEFLDNGIGIPKDELHKVKEKFFKGKTSKSKNGLGLSISDEIMKLHNGSLEIDSVYGEWTKVILKLLIVI